MTNNNQVIAISYCDFEIQVYENPLPAQGAQYIEELCTMLQDLFDKWQSEIGDEQLYYRVVRLDFNEGLKEASHPVQPISYGQEQTQNLYTDRIADYFILLSGIDDLLVEENKNLNDVFYGNEEQEVQF